jgi:hypothetical protein
MICSQCAIDKDEDQFLCVGGIRKEVCSKCIYKNKTKDFSIIAINRKQEHCLICKNAVEGRRWKYCSEKCAETANRKNISQNWRHKLVAPPISWKNTKF